MHRRIPMWETHVNYLFNIFGDLIPKSRKKHQDSWLCCYWCHNIKRSEDGNPAARIWVRRRNHGGLFMEAQMAEGKTAVSEPARQEKHWQETQLHFVNISLRFERVLILLLDNDIWHFSYMTCIQTAAIKVWTGKHLEGEKKPFT